MLLLGCGEIRLKTGSDETEIEIDSLRWDFINSYYSPMLNNEVESRGWLLNKETGELHACTKRRGENGYCSEVATDLASKANRIRVDADGNIIGFGESVPPFPSAYVGEFTEEDWANMTEAERALFQ